LNNKVKIIYLSGIDGCGKTTQAKFLVEYLKNQGIRAEYLWFRWEPSLRKFINRFRNKKTKLGSSGNSEKKEVENIENNEWELFKKRMLSNSLIRRMWMSYACADYFASYRKHQFNNITAEILVLDRYIDDFIIDQSINMSIPPNNIGTLMDNFFLKRFHYPDLKVIIDIPAREGYTRKSDGTSLTYLETREKYYQAICDANTIHLDGLKSIKELREEIATWVSSKLKGAAE